MASSSPDVKALFNGAPSYIHPKLSQPFEHTEEDGSDYHFNGDEPVEDNWTPLPPIVRSLRITICLSLTAQPQGSGYSHRSRHSEDAIKRGSDGLLDAKLRDQLTHARSMSDRARSLDLTASLSRITEATSGGFPESESPADDDFPHGADSPAMMPSFPSVYGPPASGRSSGGAPGTPQSRRSVRTLDEEAVTSALQNLGV
jgi:hypothetical protein